MPKHCKQCEEWYIVKLNDKPEIHCMWCKVGIHDCIEINEAIGKIGFKWLYDTCDPVFIKHFMPKLDQAASFDGFCRDMRGKNGEHNKGKKQETTIAGNNKKTNKEQKRNTSKEDKATKANNEEETDEPEDMDEDSANDDEDDMSGNNNTNNTIQVVPRVQPSSNIQPSGTTSSSNNNDNNNHNNNNHNTDRVCWKWVNFKCWRNNSCKYDHPEMCEADIDRKPCSKNPCNLYHPQLCNANQNRKVCRWGEKCKYRHTQDNIPRYSHRKHNNTSHHRTPDDNYNRPRENYRNSTDFRREWPTLREEEILRKLMYMIQMEAGNWSPMDGRRPRY